LAKVNCECKQCGSIFSVYASQIKRGGGKFCSIGCGTKYRNLTDNPAWRDDVKRKISENHAPVPWLFDYRFNNYKGLDVKSYRKKALRKYGEKCNRCDCVDNLHVHHKDRNRKNNDIENLEVLCADCHQEEHKYEFSRERCPNTGRFLSTEKLKGDDVVV
jgi:hypothetical protein